MTDARLPRYWLTNPKFIYLSDGAWRAFSWSLMYGSQNGTDGYVPERMMRYLRLSGVSTSIIAELEAAGLWKQLNDGIQVVDWDVTQSTNEQVQRQRERKRANARRYRSKQREQTENEGAE
jgi:hypothetical protein